MINDEYFNSIKRHNYIKEKIIEKERLINLLLNPGIRKETELDLNKLKEIYLIKRIQNFWRKKREKKKSKIIGHIQENNYSHLSKLSMIIKIQRYFRKYKFYRNIIARKNKNEISFYNDIFHQISFEKLHNIHDIIIRNNIKFNNINDYNLILENYKNKYLNFNLEFSKIINIKFENKIFQDKILEQIEFLEIEQDFKQGIFSKYKNDYFDYKDIKNSEIELENNINHSKDIDQNYFNDLEDKLIIQEIDNHFNLKYFEDYIYN